jgi:hypothetical protein
MWPAALAALALGAAAIPALAHHSIGAKYDRDKTVELDGRLIKAEFINPHALFQIEVRSPSGEVIHWQVESRGVQGMAGSGLNSSIMATGQQIKVKGNPAHNGDNHLWLTSVHTTNGAMINLAQRP